MLVVLLSDSWLYRISMIIIFVGGLCIFVIMYMLCLFLESIADKSSLVLEQILPYFSCLFCSSRLCGIFFPYVWLSCSSWFLRSLTKAKEVVMCSLHSCPSTFLSLVLQLHIAVVSAFMHVLCFALLCRHPYHMCSQTCHIICKFLFQGVCPGHKTDSLTAICELIV
jgi:hypothetical protein